MSRERVTPNDQLGAIPSGRRVTVAGLVLVRQRPGSAKGVIFMTLEDEGHVANVIVWPKTLRKIPRHRHRLAAGARSPANCNRESGVIHIVAEHIEDISARLSALTAATFGDNGLANADEVRRPVMDIRSNQSRARMAAILNAAKPHGPPPQREPERKAEAVMPEGAEFPVMRKRRRDIIKTFRN